MEIAQHDTELQKGKREINKEKAKKRLLKEAFLLFTIRGYEQTTVADIVSACEIGRGTFYNYYPDVKAIFSAVIEDVNFQIQTVIKESRKDAHGIYEFLYLSFKSYFDFVSTKEISAFFKANQAYIRDATYASNSIQQMISDIHDDFKAHKVIGDFKEDYEFQLLSVMLIGAPSELFLNMHFSERNISTDEMAEFLAKMFTKILWNKEPQEAE